MARGRLGAGFSRVELGAALSGRGARPHGNAFQPTPGGAIRWPRQNGSCRRKAARICLRHAAEIRGRTRSAVGRSVSAGRPLEPKKAITLKSVTLGELSVPIAWYERVILLREEEAQEPVAAWRRYHFMADDWLNLLGIAL